MLEKELLAKKVFPDKLLHLLGPVFFYEELKIPKEKYYQFITYCTFSGIFEQYQNDKIMLLIKTLKKEANIFLTLKNWMVPLTEN